MEAVLAETSIGITDLKKNPSAVIRAAGSETVVVLHHNKPSAYLVPAPTYEALMEVLDDLQLIPLVQQRIANWQTNPGNVITVSRADLEREARGTTSPHPRMTAAKPVAKSATKQRRGASAAVSKARQK